MHKTNRGNIVLSKGTPEDLIVVSSCFSAILPSTITELNKTPIGNDKGKNVMDR